MTAFRFPALAGVGGRPCGWMMCGDRVSRMWTEPFDKLRVQSFMRVRVIDIAGAAWPAESSHLVAISAWQPEVHGRGVLRLVVVLCGTTAFGAIHVIAEYAIMIRFSDANWDSPPGTGYLTVAVITISAIVTAIMTLRTPQRGRDDEPQTDPRSGSLTLA